MEDQNKTMLKLLKNNGNDADLVLLDLIEEIFEEMSRLAVSVKEAKKSIPDFNTAIEAMSDKLQGVGIESIEEEGRDLIITLTDNNEVRITEFKGENGKDGKDGEDAQLPDNFFEDIVSRIQNSIEVPVKGIHYYTEDEVQEVVDRVADITESNVQPLLKEHLETTKTTSQELLGKETAPSAIVDKLQSLEGDDRLSASAIKELPEYTQTIEDLRQSIAIVDSKVVKVPIGLEVFKDGRNLGRFPSINFRNGSVVASASRIDVDLSDGGGGGVSLLSQLNDVTITSVQDDDLLQYNSTTMQWENVSITSLDGDEDWYVENSTDVPTNITDNIYHDGKVGIGDYSSSTIGADFEILDGTVDIARTFSTNSREYTFALGENASFSSFTAQGVAQTYTDTSTATPDTKFSILAAHDQSSIGGGDFSGLVGSYDLSSGLQSNVITTLDRVFLSYRAASASDRSSITLEDENVRLGSSTTMMNIKTATGDVVIGNGVNTPTARLEVRGEGTGTDNTFQLNDSNGNSNMFMQDDGTFAIGNLASAALSTQVVIGRAVTAVSAATRLIKVGYQSTVETFDKPDEIIIGDLNAHGGVGTHRLSIGHDNHITSSGTGGIVIGSNVDAQGFLPTVVNASASVSMTVSNDNVISIGAENEPNGDFATILGTNIVALEDTINLGRNYTSPASGTVNFGFDATPFVRLSDPNFSTSSSYINSDIIIGSATNNPKATLDVDGSFAAKARKVSASGSGGLSGDDFGISASSTSGTLTLGLSSLSTSEHRVVSVTRQSGAGLGIELDGSGSETINGETTYTIQGKYDAVMVHNDGDEWKVIADSVPSEYGQFNIAPEETSGQAHHPVRFTALSGTNDFGSVDEVYAALFRVNKEITVASLKNRYAVPTGTVAVRMGIYTHNDSTWRPDDLVSGTEVSVSVTGSSLAAYTGTFSSPVTLDAGQYYWVVMVSDSDTTETETYSAAWHPLMAQEFSSSLEHIVGVQVNSSGASSSLPSTLTGSFSTTSSTQAIVYPTLILN